MENKTFTFHIHLPEGIENIGQPIVLGDIKELGFWENPVVKLFQPFPKNPTYWQSEPTIISVSNIPEKNYIQYRFAIHIPKPPFHEKNVFEGNSDEDNRILDIEKENQFAIWKNNFNLSQKLSLDQIQDYAFVDYIFNSIEIHNFKDKVMEYQHLLDLHNDVTVCASNFEYIVNNIDDKLKEKRLFLCLLLGYHILRQDLNYELPTSFSSELLLDALDNYKQEIFPSDVKVLFHAAITNLIQHNAFQYQFHWLKIFTLMATIDPKYNFIYHLNTLKYPNDDLLEKFIKEAEIISPHIKNIDFNIYVKIAKWLIQLCHNNNSLFKLWNDILAHNKEIDKNIFKFFIDQIQKNISNGDSIALENDFNRIPKNCHDDVTEVFRNHILFLLENPIRKWESRDIFAIQKLLQNDGLNWSDDDAIISLEYISQSRSLELLNIFPEILDNFFRNNFSDTKKKRLPSICTNWFTLLLFKLSANEKNISNEVNFISLIFQLLERMHPLLSHRKNIWQNLTTIVVKKVKSRPESQIIDAIILIGQIKEQEIKELFSDIIKEVIFIKTIQQINDRLIGKIFTICGCKGSKILKVPNTMIEDILCYILDELQRKSNVSDASEQYINIIKSSKFLILILNSTGSVERLNANSYLQHIQMSIVELNSLLIEETINLQLLQQLLKYSDEQLFQYFDEIIGKKSLGHLIISRDEIAKLRKLYHDYELKLDQLLKFYNNHCSESKVMGVNNFIQDIKKRMQNLDKVILNKSILSDYWKLHEKTLDSAKRCYKFGQSQIFNNIFEVYLREDDAAINVEYIAQILTPAVFKKYDALCKEWEKFKCSDASLKNITNVDVEIELIEYSSSSKNQKFTQALKNLSKRPQWIERFEHLKKVVKIFKVPHNEDNWLSKSIRILKDDSVTLRVLNNFFDYLDKNHSVSQGCWGLIKELSIAKDLMVFLQIIGKFDTRKLLNYVNSVDKHLDIQEDTISSLIQVEQFLFPLMNKVKVENIDELLKELQDVIIKNSSLGGKVALCNNYSMTLRMTYNTILNRGEITKENIKNIVLNGIYIFVRDERKDKCIVSLKYSSNVMYNLNEILDLRVRALSIAKKDTDSTSIDDILNDYDTVMDDFIFQVDVAQEIIVTVSVLIQLGHFHFGNKNFEKKLQGTNNMEDYLKFLNNELEKWKDIVDRARERCYYLTFFSVRHILTLYDYFTSEKLDKKNEEECKTLIRFVNSKDQLPSRNEVVLCGSKDDPETLHKIGDELKRIFEDSPKQMRKFNVTGQRVMSDIVTKSKLFVAACTDSSRIPNVIMSLYANHGYYPEPWQLLICTSLTTMEELMIFIKRSFFASNNGYNNYLFCIANLELLDFELQYNLVNQIRAMQKLHDQEIDYLLALICYKKTGMHHYILDQFSRDVHETNGLSTETMREVYRKLCQSVIRVSSDLSGQGKTEWIKEASFAKKKILRSFLISDGMGFDKLVTRFKECKLQQTESMHINIVSTDHPEDVNMFLFELLTLGMVSTNDIAYLPSLETPTYVFIEIASTIEQRLLNSLPMAGYILFNHLTWNIKNLSVSQEINSPIQIVCHYLSLLDCNKIDIKEVHFRTNEATKKPLSVERCQSLIDKYIFNNNIKVVSSFRFFEIFINVFTDQLVRLSSNQHFTLNNLGNLKLIVEEANIALILRILIGISKDFAARSIKTRATELESIAADGRNFVQWDDFNNFILFFNSQDQDTITLLYSDRTKAYDNAKLLLKSDHSNWKLDDYVTMSENEILMKLERMVRRSTQKLSLPEYVLSSDNLIKMALILLRVRSNVPVVICGEAGCGKTSLIAYLAIMIEVQFQTLNLHAGIDEKTFMLFINDAMKKAGKGEIWLLFNGINTCNQIELLADLISRRMLNGKYIHPNIRLFSTCNPYRLRTGAQSKAIDLTTKVKKYEEKSNLVYQVTPLPDQILDYVFDYGILNSKDELKYIQIMVEKELKKLSHPVFVELLSASQRFIRKVEEPYSVSLRDVKRAITLVEFFYNSLEKRQAYKRGHTHPPSENPTITTRSYVLALSFCYYFRLYEQDLRKQYHHDMGQILQTHNFDLGEDVFAEIIREEQEYYINRMEIPSNVAINEALSENILVMIVCILTRIPLFLIGTPGSSKSLAINLISSNLNGFNSRDEYFRTLPQVYLITHQGSLSSTPDDIIKVFDKAKKYQETDSKEFPIISVVLLNEVGLDEMSPFNPLSVLHSLLEPSYPDTELTVAVIGISNWRPDNSKISRAILVQRPQLNLDDLVSTTVHLLNIELGDQRDTLELLPKAYLDYEKCGQILPNFHGLHDYYALVKQLSLDEMTPANIQTALARNFGGIENNVKLYEKHFGNVFKMYNNNHEPWVYKPIPIEKLINLDLEDPDARPLMVIGRNDTILNLLTRQLKVKNLDPVVILGSQFSSDRDDYLYNVLSKILMCIEEGRLLILVDLETIYEILYDLWNQNYIVIGSKENAKYFIRVALEAYTNLIYVSPNFKCILVMDEKNLASVESSFLSRFEKQTMSINDILNDRQKSLVESLKDWSKRMTTYVGANPVTKLLNKFTHKDLFIGFDKDETLQSLVIDITKNNPEAENSEILENCKECLVAIASSDGIIRAEQSVLGRDEADRWKHLYYYKQNHDSIYDYFSTLFNQERLLTDSERHLVIVNTFSSIFTDVKCCLQGLVTCQVDTLSAFKTEAQFSNWVKHFWLKSTDNMLILQCDVTTVNTRCIKLAKFIIEQFRNEYMAKEDHMEQEKPMKHACIILHIHRNRELTLSFNFMCGWKQITIETLPRYDTSLLDKSLCDIINCTYPFEKILQEELLWCLSCMKYPSNDISDNHVKILSEKILKCPNFIKCLKEKTLEWIKEKSINDRAYKVALNGRSFTSFSLSFQVHIRTLIRKPIAQILCALERLSATNPVFYIDNDEGLFKFWQQIFMNNKIVKIEDLSDPKPDGYIMTAESLYDLKFPFSLYFMKQIDNFKRYYEEEVAILRQDEDRIDGTTNELYDWIIEDHLKDFKNNIFTSVPELKDSLFEWVSELYFNDFVTVIATNNGGSKNTKMLTTILKLLFSAEKLRQPIFLHSYWWKNGNEILAQLQLTQMFPIIIQNIEIRGNAIIKGSLEKYLVKEAIKLMLQRIYGNFDGVTNSDKWQYDVTKVLSLTNKITRAKNLPDIQLLHIVNDLVATKAIPLDDIKEIVQLGQSSDKHEVLPEKFINTVLDKLDKLEQNEKNLIPKRSFIIRCLGFIPLESDIRLSLYKKLFSYEPFSLMGAIIEKIFLKEDTENEDIFFTVISDFEKASIQSPRLNVINKCLGDLDTHMATLCCDTIEQTFFMNEELENLAAFIGPALEALYKQGIPPLQKITSIALLKEFVHRFWDSFIKKDNKNPDQMEDNFDNDFDNNDLLDQINNIMTFVHPLIHSLKIYLLRDLCRRDFSMDDIRKFCDAQKHLLPWLGSFNWEDIKENRLSFNPYCYLPEYNEAENSIMYFYSVGNKAPFQKFIQNMNQNMTLTAKLSLMGLFFVRFHVLRASREWQHSEEQSAKFLTQELAGINLPDLLKTIATNILSNKQPLLKINGLEISNTELLIKSVIAHIIIFHASVEPNSSRLAMYLHKLLDCQNLFILSCISDVESIVLNAVAAEYTGTNYLTRYACKCGMKYVIGNSGAPCMSGICPDCGNKIGGEHHRPFAGNTKLDNKPSSKFSVNDQIGYIGEIVNQDLYHSVRYMTPTSYRILHLIVHTLIGASGPQTALAFLQKNNQIATDSEEYCMDHIRNDWEMLKKLLDCSDANLALMFHSLISSMMEKPLPNQQVTSSAEREKWETEFNNYITPLIKNINETATNYRTKLSEALSKNQKGYLIESEINQTLVMDQRYRSENLPNLWRTIGMIELELLKHLLPIIKFVQILHSKLGYQLTRQTAREMTFRQFIYKESNGGDDDEIFNSLKTAFDDFKFGWNTVISLVNQYQCHELPDDKPAMRDDSPVVFGLVEQKDSGIYLCAILYHLVNIQNKFLQEIIEIPPGTCKSLKFLDETTFDFGSSTSKTKPETPNGYCLQSMYLDQVRSANIINFEWDDEILAYSQRNLAIARGEDIVYDLTKIEAELANILVFEKVYIETQSDSQLYLEVFPYHLELFQGYMRILSDIENLITQEPIPIEKMNLLDHTLDNGSEILSSLEFLLCFVKRTAVRDKDISIKDYISKWVKLSSLSTHEGFSKFLNIDLRLKHLVALYEFVEEQVADVKIKYIHEKYKEELSADMKAAIMNSVDFKQQTTMKIAIPAEAFSLALKRFMFRFLTLENQKEMEPLYVYLQDSSLNLWPSTIPENIIDELFPENLLVANTYDAYKFIMIGIEQRR
ncbi:hypothetical protein RhiirB3_428014 [Rhizophagus irregularis]|nr:hypothetical protein RhiirB3_428014 [Rhizophagus irregularis]